MSGNGTLGAYLEQAPAQEAATENAETQQIQQEQTAVSDVAQDVKKDDVQQQQTQQAQTAPEPTEDNVAVFDIGKISEEKKVATETPATAVVDWKAELKKADPIEVAKTIGISDFAIELDNHIKNGGDVLDYINARAIDYNKVSDEDLIRESIKEKLPDLTEEQLDLYIQKKYNQGYLAEEDEKEFGLIQMKAEAQELRKAKIAQQQSFKIADPSLNEEVQKQQQEYQQKIQKYTEVIQNHEATKNLLNNKRVTVNLGEGTPAFNFQIGQPEVLMELFSNNEAWVKAISLPTGEPDVAKMQRIALAALNPNYEKSLVDYGKSLGKKMLIDEGQNAKKPIGAPPSDPVKSIEVTGKKGTFGQYIR